MLYRASLRGVEITYLMKREAFLENLAHAARGLAELQGRDAGSAMERAHEIGEIAKTHVIGDVGDVAAVLGQQPRGLLEPAPHEILMRGDPEHAREQPQE